MKKRIVSIIITAVMLMSLAVTGYSSDYIPKEHTEHAEGIAAAALGFAPSYKFDPPIAVSELEDIMAIVYNDNPELFHLSNAYKYTYGINEFTGETVVLNVLLNYTMTKDGYDSAMDEVKAWISSVISLADSTFTELEYAVFFHDYICANYEYDTSHSVRDLYGFIKYGRGVCQSYVYAYSMLMRGVGIEVSWAHSAEMNHVWNLVKIDGEWYHADLTWDDPVGNIPGAARHKYFLKSDSAFTTAEIDHFGWTSPYSCTSVRFDNSTMSAVDSAFAHLSGKWYFTAKGDLFAADSPDGAASLVKEYGLIWNVWNSTAYYVDNYSAVMVYKGDLFITTPKTLVMVGLGGASDETVYTYSGNEGYIYGFRIDMGADGVSGAAFPNGDVMLNITKDPIIAGKSLYATLGSTDTVGGKGDADKSGRVNLADASLMLKYIAKWNVTLDTEAADFDSSGTVNITDVSHVLKCIAGWYK